MALDAKQLGSALNTIAYGEVMKAAVRDYVKEVGDQERGSGDAVRAVDVDDLLDDPELEKLHADRIAAMKKEAERRVELERKGHGTYDEVTEGDFLEITTDTENVVCHFFHKDFERCKIVDKHLALLAKKYMETRFIKLSAPDSPFFTVKLGIKVLPCVVLFKHGRSVDRVVGFEQLGGKDDFPTAAFEARLKAADVVTTQRRGGRGGDHSSDDEDGRRGEAATALRRGVVHLPRDDDDESSDFD
ncbi:thioredoxin domain-containing protein-like [Raphidocelis subcapitata]|uniref:Thioredoxin domain-containing protein-like n=1 Tax=Raphidocelis subcapitata TaxID=307507 RepID=A0A2V0NU91_9CHLO|nr:thioredoxin domain-containing protein-like [Raphidocelis subcapitata]|eukprot:GBF90242.1 thioredoxin domain-containing protein-like [Raphidocelis subcapitata]